LAGRDRSDHFFTINSADGDWQTHQRSPGHQGYVPISVDPTHFAYAWDWSRDPDSEPNTTLWAFEADTGGYIFKSPFSSQWPSYMAPTVFGDQVYTGGGYYGGINYSFSTEDGSPLWSHSADGLWDMYTPAVNDSYVFHYY
jgi:outer membrane protein assembly factor BamB